MNGVELKIEEMEGKMNQKINGVENKIVEVERKLTGVEEYIKEILNIIKNK